MNMEQATTHNIRQKLTQTENKSDFYVSNDIYYSELETHDRQQQQQIVIQNADGFCFGQASNKGSNRLI